MTIMIPITSIVVTTPTIPTAMEIILIVTIWVVTNQIAHIQMIINTIMIKMMIYTIMIKTKLIHLN